MTRQRNTIASVIVALSLAALASCGSDPQVVSLGGATVQRPWGVVTTFPQVRKEQIPTVADLDFARHMIVHHRQAVELSRLVLEHPEIDERVAAAARFIEHDQGLEITAMRQWLQAWESTPEVLPHAAHHLATMPSERHMPGMVAAGRIAHLALLGPAEAQLEFVHLMTSHHEGAVTMSQQFLRAGDNDFALGVARHLVREQNLEITYLRRLTADLAPSAGRA